MHCLEFSVGNISIVSVDSLNTESTKCRFFEPSFSSRIDFFASGINKYLATLDKKLVTPHSKCFVLSLSKIFPRFEI